MFCSHCGKEIADKAVFCVHCGVPTGELATGGSTAKSEDAKPKKFPVAALVGMLISVLTFFASMFAYAFGIMLAANMGANGILSIWLLILAVSVIGLIFGIIAISRLKKNRLTGLSIAAMVLGMLVFIMALITTVFWGWIYSIASLV